MNFVTKQRKRWNAQLLSNKQEVDRSIYVKPLAEGGDTIEGCANYNQSTLQVRDFE